MSHSIDHRNTSISPLALPIKMPVTQAQCDEAVADRLHPAYRPGLARLPRGRLVSRGLPFDPPDGPSGQRWLVLERDTHIGLGGVTASHLVLLQFCDAWRDEDDERPEGTPIGWVTPVGEPLVRARIEATDGAVIETVLRRRFEVGEGIVGWGGMAFLAVPHTVEEPLDWRGPHARQEPGSYAVAGHAGPLTILPGTWGGNQTGVQDHVPSATGELTLWLHAIDVRDSDGRSRAVEALRFEPIEGEGRGRLIVLVAVTAFDGVDSPLRWSSRRAIRLDGATDRPISLDLGVIARRAALGIPPEGTATAGWAVSEAATIDTNRTEIVELTGAADARLVFDDAHVTLGSLQDGAPATVGPVRIELLADVGANLEVSIRDADGRLVAARVRAAARDGRPLPPMGHRVEINPAIYEDTGAGVVLHGNAYAYVDGSCIIPVPRDGGLLEVVHGLETPPQHLAIDAADVVRGTLQVQLEQAISPTSGRWVSGDTHVHFLSPTTALLQARAENINVVHLLATQWGDHHTGITDFGGDQVSRDGEHAVWVGSENRQNMLGHVGIVGTSQPVLPFASGGAPEGPIGASVTHLMADWLARCRDLGGLAIGAHFPLPMAEIAADIDAGLLDALELQCFDQSLESPPIQEWYRYLDAGYRLPLVGGTDKMSAEVPLGQVRTWARLADDTPLDLRSWAAAVRTGRTFVSSGPLLDFTVDGALPGDQLDRAPGDVASVELIGRAGMPIISALEIVVDGAVVASVSSDQPTTDLALRERVRLQHPGWIAARSRSPYAIGSAFASAMAAHTSAVYIAMAGQARRRPDLTTALALVDGTRAWVEHMAPIRDAAERERFRAFLLRAESRLRKRSETETDGL